tara:strand:- start:1460 stop:1837 length:378 start_codon:yes stop_codon:yes gene_type:complete
MIDKIENYLISLNILNNIPFLENISQLLLLVFLLALIIFFLLALLIKKGIKKKTNSQERKQPVLDEIIDKEEIKINDENDFVDVLVAIEEEMNAVRELYVGGYISKGVYISETDRLYEKAKIFGL